jgi:hypothetical protein
LGEGRGRTGFAVLEVVVVLVAVVVLVLLERGDAVARLDAGYGGSRLGGTREGAVVLVVDG